jgi:hypothetical protein
MTDLNERQNSERRRWSSSIEAHGQTVPARCGCGGLLTIGAMYPVAKAEATPTPVAGIAMNDQTPPPANVAPPGSSRSVLLPRMHQLPINVM